VNLDDTIYEVKKKIFEKLNYLNEDKNLDGFFLVCCGFRLEEGSKLGDYTIPNNATIYLNGKVKG
jgi:hypothetical protein